MNALEPRAQVMAALRYVDCVVGFAEDTPLAVITRLLPDVLVKGADYTVETVVGADVVQRAGGRVMLAQLVPGQSTTAILARSRRRSHAGDGRDRESAGHGGAASRRRGRRARSG